MPTAFLSEALDTRASTTVCAFCASSSPSASICVICGFKKLAGFVTVLIVEDGGLFFDQVDCEIVDTRKEANNRCSY